MTTMHDGIEEHDNHLPSWWLATLFGAIVFAFAYWTYYHTLAVGPSQAAELAADQATVAAVREASAPPVSNEVLAAASRDPLTVERGRAIFASNCVACHGARGEGVVGPNLTDAYWIHGGSAMEVHAVISKGVLDKGMLAWGNVLGAAKVRDVTAFVVSLAGTNVSGKEPQGIKVDAK
jgi:cytochrome c oxidase cbb3-type subunit III